MRTVIYLTIIIQITCHSVSLGQEFAPIGAKWYFHKTTGFSPNVGVILQTSIGDTIINNKQSKVILKGSATCFGSYGELYYHESGDSIFKYNPINESFELYFIFNAEVGTQWITTYSPTSIEDIAFIQPSSTICTVDSISYFHLEHNDSLRVQHVTMYD